MPVVPEVIRKIKPVLPKGIYTGDSQQQHSQQEENQSVDHLDSRLLRVKRSAEYLDSTIWFVRSLIWSGKIKKLRLGKRDVIDRADLDAFIEKNKR